MIHFTTTGFLAGQAICGKSRNSQETYRHIPSQSEVKHIINMRGVEGICPDCLSVWVDSFRTDDEGNLTPDWEPCTEQWVKDLDVQLREMTAQLQLTRQTRTTPALS